MAIAQKDTKLLWGRSGNRCAICRAQLTQDAMSVTAAYALGEQAHIVGEKEYAPRGASPLALSERNSYHNLILLCPNCHTEIDKNESDWPVEKLYKAKSEHELWVSETLSETIDHVKFANDTAVAAIVDSAVTLCDLENWRNWTSSALDPDPIWADERIKVVYDFRRRLVGAIWPEGMDEFKSSTITLAAYLHRASEKFLQHAEMGSDGAWRPVKFFKLTNPNPNYDEDLEKYEAWLDECYALIHQATRAANWFADVVRRDVNPLFFLEHGKFLVEEGPFMDFSWRTRLLEFTGEEKVEQPSKALAE